MANIKITSACPLYDGMPITFKAPCDCTAVEGLTVAYGSESQSFGFRDAHGNDLTGIGNLFTEGAYVKAILNTANGYAYLQNADTNKYLEAKFSTHNTDTSAHADIRTIASTAQTTASNAAKVADEAQTLANVANGMVGDIKVTLRTDLGDKWMLCNGAEIFEEDVPELFSLRPDVMTAQQLSEYAYFDCYSIKRQGDTIVMVGNDNGTSNTDVAVCYTTTNPYGEWTRVELPNGSTCYDVYYHNGTWIAVGYYSSNNYIPRIWVSTDPASSWDEVLKLTSYTSYGLSGVCYHNGNIVAVGFHTSASSSVVYVAPEDNLYNWTSYTVSGIRASGGVYCHTDGTLIMYGMTNYMYYSQIAYATDPTGTWTTKTLGSTSSGNFALVAMLYSGNQIVAFASGGNVYTATDPAGTWTRYTSATNGAYMHMAYYHDGVYYVLNTNKIVYAYKVLGETGAIFIPSTILYTRGFYIDEDYTLISGYNASDPYYSEVGLNRRYLPTITHDDSYTYIKAKE